MRYIALNLTSCLLCAGCWMVQSGLHSPHDTANTDSGPSQGGGGHMASKWTCMPVAGRDL